ncbi:MAG: Uma2 family endonuclease [Oscillatoriales cyanobacterium SM2_1_8]|nr:Uma2 family endonuclease [Oscillatoriales cyanobacterium SM2_1_8]
MAVSAFTDTELYPSSDGQPMAENTVQYRWIVLIKENLERWFADRPDVFIAGDLLWYPLAVAVPPAPCQAPDVMVVLGRPKGDRPSYKQFEEGGGPPQVVFEILSESNRGRRGQAEMANKFRFYEQYGVEEYYIYDPERRELRGWQRQGATLAPIVDVGRWVSPLLGVSFFWEPGTELVLSLPNGERFLTPLAMARDRERQRRQRRIQVEQQWQQAAQRAIAEQERRQQAEQRAAELAARLRALGLEP